MLLSVRKIKMIVKITRIMMTLGAWMMVLSILMTASKMTINRSLHTPRNPEQAHPYRNHRNRVILVMTAPFSLGLREAQTVRDAALSLSIYFDLVFFPVCFNLFLVYSLSFFFSIVACSSNVFQFVNCFSRFDAPF